MNTRTRFGLIAAGIAAIVAIAALIALWRTDEPQRGDNRASTAAPAGHSEGRIQTPTATPGAVRPSAPPARTAADSISEEQVLEGFEVDATGKLVLNEQTRLNIEALVARTDPKDLNAAAQSIASKLPAIAAAQVLDLITRYDNYQRAQESNYREDQAPATEDDAAQLLESLHALRVAHFGPDVAKAFYGEEEAVTRELLELVRLEKDQSLTMEERAEKAQRLRDTLPEVAAIERRNRELANER